MSLGGQHFGAGAFLDCIGVGLKPPAERHRGMADGQNHRLTAGSSNSGSRACTKKADL
jgi:hypothetical protein